MPDNPALRMHLKQGTMIVCVSEDIRGKYAEQWRAGMILKVENIGMDQ